MTGKVIASSSADDQHTSDATCLLYYADHVFSGGADGKIKIWNTSVELVKEIDAHESYIYAMAVDETADRLYSSSADGTIRYFQSPITTVGNSQVLMRTQYDEIGALCCSRGGVLWSGDDKGVVIKWVDHKIAFKYNIVEEVRSMCVENTLLYTARDLDAVITDLGSSKTGQYVCVGTIPGRAPLALVGPEVVVTSGDGKPEVVRRKWLVFTTRDGKGLMMVKNERKFEKVWLKEGAHEMIINALCGNANVIFTAGYDGHVRKWTELDMVPVNVGDAVVGHCINALCVGPDDSVFVGDTRGTISRVGFSIKAG